MDTTNRKSSSLRGNPRNNPLSAWRPQTCGPRLRPDAAGQCAVRLSCGFGAGSLTGQTAICLADFAVLAGSAIAGSGSSTITGDVGVSLSSMVPELCLTHYSRHRRREETGPTRLACRPRICGFRCVDRSRLGLPCRRSSWPASSHHKPASSGSSSYWGWRSSPS